MYTEQNSQEKELHPHPLPWVAYFVWALCLMFSFYMYLVQFNAWEIPSNKITSALILNIGIGRQLVPYNIAIILFQLPIALLIDKFGPRHMSSIFIFLTAIGVLFLSFSTSRAGFWFSAFVMGIGGTITIVNTLKLISNWFLPKRFTIMLGWTSFAMVIGAIVGQKLTRELIVNFQWSKIMFTYGLVGILYAVIFFTFVRDSQVGIRYRMIPDPKKFKMMHSVKKALSRGENYVLALFCGLVFAQWYTFYDIWHTHFYRSSYQINENDASLLNLAPMACFAIGVVLFLYLASHLKKRKVFMIPGLIIAIILSICTIYIPNLPIALHVLLDCVIALSISTSTLVYTLIYEKNIPAISATVIGILQIFLAIFRIFGERLILFILGMTSGANYQPALIVVPFSLIIALIVLFFIKETYGKQIYEE